MKIILRYITICDVNLPVQKSTSNNVGVRLTFIEPLHSYVPLFIWYRFFCPHLFALFFDMQSQSGAVQDQSKTPSSRVALKRTVVLSHTQTEFRGILLKCEEV